MPSLHEPVLLNEVLSHLSLKSGDTVVDGTVGGGGHSEAILKLIGPKGLLIGMDQDQEALDRAQERLKNVSSNFILKKSNFVYLDEILASLNVSQVNAVLLDVGFSRDQVEASQRGFSFLREGPLDMRMDLSQARTAQDIIMNASEQELQDIFWHYGEERQSRRIARAIVQDRDTRAFNTTRDLASLVERISPPKLRFARLHPATRIFQALRIAVNDELRVLQETLPKAFHALTPNGRLAVISFHSLEDRLVKQYFVSVKNEKSGIILTKKPIIPTEEEISRNPMSRSAKLRVVERL